MKRLLVLVLLMLVAPFTLGTSGDTASQIVPTVVHPIPDIAAPAGQPYTINGFYYIPCVTYQGSTAPLTPTFALSKPIPGMAINATTGMVTGTPTTAVSGVALSCTTANGTASDTFNLTLAAGVIAQGYFVDCANGNDANAGTTFGAPWKTVAKVNSTVTTPGVDVWFDGSCAIQQLVIDWSGSAADRVIIGSYNVVSGVAYQNTPTNPTAWPTQYTYPRAIGVINGSCPTLTWDTPACVRKTSNAYPGDAASGQVPQSWTRGLIEPRGNFITIQDLKCYGSAGYCLLADAVTPFYHDVIVQRFFTDRSLNAAVRFYLNQNMTLRDSVMRNIATIGTPDNCGSGCTAANPAAIALSNAHSGMVNNYLIEGNDVASSHGGGIQPFYYPNSIIIRGNRLGEMQSNRPCVYGDDGIHLVLEYNICYGGGFNDAGQEIYRSRGFVFTYENLGTNPNSGNPAKVALTDVVMRGNMLTNTKGCFEFGGFGSPTEIQSGRIYNNSCLNALGAVISMASLPVTNTFEFKNNIFATDLSQAGGTGGTPAPGTVACALPATTKPTFDHNMWNTLPNDPLCRSATDITGTAVVAGNPTNMQNPNASNHVVTPADFVMQPGSPGLNAGIPLSMTLLAAGDFPQKGQIVYPCATFDLQGSITDAKCVARGNTPSLGAMQ